jgi:DNA repair exonuclease SbcCD ATPase subunit
MKANKARGLAEGKAGELEGVVRKGEERAKEVERALRGKEEEVKRAEGERKRVEERAREAEAEVSAAEEKARKAEERAHKIEQEAKGLRAKVEKAEGEAKAAREREAKKEEERKGVQGELDDLLEVFGDLEEKVTKYKVSASRVGWCWNRANPGFRNGSRRWARRCLTERTMKTARMARRRRRMRNRGVETASGVLRGGLSWIPKAGDVHDVHFRAGT